MPPVTLRRRNCIARKVEACILKFALGNGDLMDRHHPATLPGGRLLLPDGEVNVGDQLHQMLRVPVVATVVVVEPDGQHVEVNVGREHLPHTYRGEPHVPLPPEPRAD